MFNNMFREFEDDSFFTGFPSSFRSMPSLGRQLQGRNDDENKGRSISTKDPFQLMMGNMSKAMEDMRSFATMDHIHEGNPNAYSYSSSSVMSYQNDGKSEPKIYQASTSTRRAPGDVRETRRTLRDSEARLEKMAIGQHIGRREKVVQKKRVNGGPIEEKKKYIEMDESDEPEFDQEWKKHAKSFRIFPSEQNIPRRNGLEMPKYKESSRNLLSVKGQRDDRPRTPPRIQGPSKSGRQRHLK